MKIFFLLFVLSYAYDGHAHDGKNDTARPSQHILPTTPTISKHTASYIEFLLNEVTHPNSNNHDLATSQLAKLLIKLDEYILYYDPLQFPSLPKNEAIEVLDSSLIKLLDINNKNTQIYFSQLYNLHPPPSTIKKIIDHNKDFHLSNEANIAVLHWIDSDHYDDEINKKIKTFITHLIQKNIKDDEIISESLIALCKSHNDSNQVEKLLLRHLKSNNHKIRKKALEAISYLDRNNRPALAKEIERIYETKLHSDELRPLLIALFKTEVPLSEKSITFAEEILDTSLDGFSKLSTIEQHVREDFYSDRNIAYVLLTSHGKKFPADITKDLIPHLISLLSDKRLNTDALRELLKAKNDPEEDLSAMAKKVLTKNREAVILAIISTFKDPNKDPDMKKDILETLHIYEIPPVSTLITLLKNSTNIKDKISIIDTLEKIGYNEIIDPTQFKDPIFEVVPELTTIINTPPKDPIHKDPEHEKLKFHAAMALANIDPDTAAQVAIPTLMSAFKDPDKRNLDKILIIKNLKIIGLTDLGKNKVTPELTTIINRPPKDPIHKDPEYEKLRFEAAMTLVEIDPDTAAQVAIPTLMASFKDPNLRYEVAYAISRLKDRGVLKLVQNLKNSSDTQEKILIINILSNINLSDLGKNKVTPELTTIINTPPKDPIHKDPEYEELRFEAACLLAEIDPDTAAQVAIPILMTALKDPTQTIYAIHALKKLRDIGMLKLVQNLKNSSDTQEKILIINILSKIHLSDLGKNKVTPELITIINTPPKDPIHKDPEYEKLRQHAAIALVEIDPDTAAQVAIPTLMTAFKDPNRKNDVASAVSFLKENGILKIVEALKNSSDTQEKILTINILSNLSNINLSKLGKNKVITELITIINTPPKDPIHKDPEYEKLRQQAAMALAEIDPDTAAQVAIPTLMTAFKDLNQKNEEKILTINILGKIHLSDLVKNKVIPELITIINRPPKDPIHKGPEYEKLREQAACLLANIDPDTAAQIAMPILIATLKDQDLREMAEKSILKLRDLAVPELTKTLKNSSDDQQKKDINELLDSIKSAPKIFLDGGGFIP